MAINASIILKFTEDSMLVTKSRLGQLTLNSKIHRYSLCRHLTSKTIKCREVIQLQRRERRVRAVMRKRLLTRRMQLQYPEGDREEAL